MMLDLNPGAIVCKGYLHLLFLCHDLILLHLLNLMPVYYTTTTKSFSSKKVGVARNKSEGEPAYKREVW
jgi:hypothetical protein